MPGLLNLYSLNLHWSEGFKLNTQIILLSQPPPSPEGTGVAHPHMMTLQLQTLQSLYLVLDALTVEASVPAPLVARSTQVQYDSIEHFTY